MSGVRVVLKVGSEPVQQKGQRNFKGDDSVFPEESDEGIDQSGQPLVAQVGVEPADRGHDEGHLLVKSVLWQQRVGFGDLDEVLMVQWQLQKLEPDALPGLGWEYSELVEEVLMLVENCLVVSEFSRGHLNNYSYSKLSQPQQLPMQEVSNEEVTTAFNRIREAIFSAPPLSITVGQIETQQAKCNTLLENMSNQDNYDHFEEIANYQDIYRRIKQLLQEAKDKGKPQLELLKALKHLFGNWNSSTPQHNKSEISEIKTEEVAIPEDGASRTLDEFFKKRESELSKKDKSFKKVLDSKEFQSAEVSVRHDSSKQSRFVKSHLRKDDEKELKMKQVIEQHKKALHKLQNKMKQQQQLNDFQKNLLKQQKNRYLSKIEELEEQIQQLCRDNYRLKQIQKTIKEHDSFNGRSLEQKQTNNLVYEPYIIKTCNNNLQKIYEKNQQIQQLQQASKRTPSQPEPFHYDYLGNKLEKEKPLTAQNFFNRKPPSSDLFAEKFPSSEEHKNQIILKALMGDSFEVNKEQHEAPVRTSQNPSNHNNSRPIQNPLNSSLQAVNQQNQSFGSINNGSRFDTFHMARTLSFINDSVLGQSRNMARISPQTSTRNKVAFFKSSLVLLRTSELQIAFKRSQMNHKMDKLRLIFYINNKTDRPKKVNINYQYQPNYFDLLVEEKLTQIKPRTQGREVIEITLISKTDLNAVTDMHVVIGDDAYDLWLPVSFIRFKKAENYRLSSDSIEMTVLPDRQFASFGNAQEVLPIMFGGRDTEQTWGYLWGECKFGSFAVKLTWRVADLLIETTEKWLDFIGFVFHFFK